MRLFTIPPALLYTITLLLTSSAATPVQRDVPAVDEEGTQPQNATLVARCDYPCGWSGQLCCAGPNLCYTDNNDQAQCADSAGAVVAGAAATTVGVVSDGGYTSTYTSTYTTTYQGSSPTAASAPQCDYAAQERLCGSICCVSGEFCFGPGDCRDAGSGGYTTAGIGGPFSAPLRPTTGTYSTETATVTPTTTVPFIAPVATGDNMTTTPVEGSSGGGGGLSGGAIAGIVIGVLLGLALLALLCFFCIVRGLWGIFAGIFGLGKRKKTVVEETYISEHHGSAGGGGGRVWYGDRPARPEREKKSGFGGWGAVAAGLGALGLGLAGKRAIDKRKERRSSKSEVSSDYYYSDYYYSDSSPSSASSGDRRTRRSSRR